MDLQITCPNCRKRSEAPFDKIPSGNLRTTCNGCGEQFVLNKESKRNCKPISDGPSYPEDGWRVDAPACQGMQYDLNGLGSLINSGLVGPETKIQPPGHPSLVTARDLKQLDEFFEKHREKLEKAKRTRR